uniref:Sperm associated antigen 1b n=1 Tax=Sinocyclocheilus rhinocerous TaxID=307959 RepID=A0A673J8J4_9TELE
VSGAPGSSSWSVPVEHLDYSFIQSCSDLKHLEQILRVLRSGQDGFYPHLIEFCEERIEKLDPESRALRKENRAATAASFSTEEWRSISEDLQLWESSMRLREAELKQRPIFSEAANVPPVRCSNLVQVKKTSCVPRPYRDWDRFDVEAECANTEESDRNPCHASCEVCLISSSRVLLSSALSVQEKDQGNEAFRSGDYEEAVAYYSRSLSLASSAAVFNNRAQAHIRLQCWSAALNDCDAALQLEPGNVKALLRRATAHKHLGLTRGIISALVCVLAGPAEDDACVCVCFRALCYIKLHCFTEAQQDCDSALQLQPTNKKAFYRRALANKGLKMFLTKIRLQQVLCLDASVMEAEQLLMEVTRLMTDSRCSSGPRRSVTITEVPHSHTH